MIVILSSTTLMITLFAAEPMDEIPIPSFDTVSPFVDSNRYTHQKSDEIAVSPNQLFDNYETLDTELGEVYVDPVSLAFQFYNSNGYLWSSTINYQLENFPMSVVYPLRSAINIASYNTDNPNFSLLREHLFTIGTTVDMIPITNGFKANIVFGTSKIEMTMYVYFYENKIKVMIPDDEINEPTGYKLNTLQVYKNFGAVKESSIPGYVFIPDGIGALIDYKEQTISVPDYKKYIYGNTISYNKETNLNNRSEDGTRIYAPVFGFVHGINQQAVFAEVLEGALYGNINVGYPGRNRGYTSVYPEFVYRNTYAQPIDQLGNDITLLQDFRNEVNIEIDYTLLEDEQANYVGMALTYRQKLLDTNRIIEKQNEMDDIPLHLSTIGLERKDGVLFKENIRMTTLNQFEDMIQRLNHLDITHIVATIDGFTRQGSSWSAPNYTNLSSKVGSSSDLNDIYELVSDLYLVTDFMKASTRSSGYNQYVDLAKKINDQLYRYEDPTDVKYLLEYSKVSSSYRASVKDLDHLNYSGFSIQSFGSLLYDDFGNDKTIIELVDTLQDLLNPSDKKTALYQANDYMWNLMDLFLEFPMYSSQFLIFDDTVPFLSIALSNTMDLFGPFANFYPYARDELLRMIDFHVYPSFIATYKSSKYLQDTGLESIYSSQFSDLEHVIVTYYDFVNQALKHTTQANIINRIVLSQGVILNEYSNGAFIIINYLDESYIHGDISIPAKDYIVGGIS